MTTTVKHYRNSFLDIENEKIRILMDPWVNTANEGSWAGTKDGNKFVFESLKEKEIDFVYISHLHTDHFDKKFLKDLKKYQKKRFKLIIKKFKDNRLKNHLISCGFKKNHIIDIDEFKVLKLSQKTKFIILPQESSSNTPSQYVKYDLDTSCVYIDENVRLYNQVDNPYSIYDIKKVMKKLRKIVDIKFDLAFIPYCAASEFPQSFINLNRKKEKNNVISSRIKKFINIGESIKCKIIVPAGGSYLLDNIFSKLNSYLAVPEFKIINNLFNKYKSKKFDVVNTNKFYFLADKYKIEYRKNFFTKYFKSKLSFDSKKIGYSRIKNRFSVSEICKKLNNLERKLPDFKKNLYNKTNTEIEINVWKKQPLLIRNFKKKEAEIKHKVFFDKRKKVQLKIHLYYKLLLGMINNQVSWNEVQNHCLFERSPNKYDPDTVMWLNLYKF